MLRLVIEDDEGGTSALSLDRSEVSIGRKEENLLHLPERNVSRQHARLLQENEAFFIEDLDSYNGVRVNGERITRRVRVTQEDLIEIGDYRLVIRPEGADLEPDAVSQSSEDTPPAFQVVDGPTAVGPAPLPPQGREVVPAMPPPPVPGGQAPPPPPATPENFVPPPPPAVPDSATPPATPPAAAAPPETPPPAAPARSEVSKSSLSTADTAVVRLPESPREEQRPREQTPEPAASERVPMPPGKLVCLAPPFEGKTYPFDRAEIVMGRSRDNGIPLDHRSVEDRHAKVIYQHGTYSVVDLGSADGLKVNDEPYRMISLRRGDILSIGSLRFRFVAPGEDFTFVPGIEEAERFVETAAARRMGMPVLLGLGAGIVVLLGIVGFFLFGGDETDAGSPQPPIEAKPDPPTVAPRPPQPTPAEPSPEQAALAADAREALQRGNKALAEENWTLAMASFKSALEDDPASQEARKLLDNAAAEQGHSGRFEECRKLFAAQDYASAHEACKNIPASSRYSKRAGELMPKIKKGYVRKHLAAAKQAFRDGDLTKASEQTEAVFIFDAENQTAKKLKKRIEDSRKKGGTRTAKAGRSPKAAKPPKATKTRAGRKSAKASKTGSRDQAKKLYVEATKYHQAGKLERAIEMYRKAVKLDPSFAYAYRGLGIAYASLGNGKMACRMYRKYLQVAPSAPDRGQVQTILQGCQN